VKQKNEWAEIYGNMKQEIEDLKKDNKILNIEVDKLQQYSSSKQNEKELAKKLKKRELECSALWETLKDMHIPTRNIFDARQMLDLLALRALDTKAKRKLKI
jgi:regulator of replication initiation timing